MVQQGLKSRLQLLTAKCFQLNFLKKPGGEKLIVVPKMLPPVNSSEVKNG
jgi:hypothetical protein